MAPMDFARRSWRSNTDTTLEREDRKAGLGLARAEIVRLQPCG
jgi:hypothetical protein